MNENLIEEFVKTLSLFSCARQFLEFQTYLKGESIFLNCLATLGGESSPSVLAKELGMSGPRISAIISRLELKLMIVRSISSKDKRCIVVKMTKKGEDFVKQTNEKITAFVADTIQKLGTEDSYELLRLMEKLFAEADDDKKGDDCTEKVS